MSGTLYVVSTPIGNLDDITLRAVKVLTEVDYIACEDTRQTLKLLNHFEIHKSLISYHQHSKISKIDKIIELLKDEKNIAAVSDAGTPGISDPGEVLISKALEEGIEVVPIPGATAVITALTASGITAKEFVFMGFLPNKKGRQTKLKEIAGEKRTIVLYESPHRIKKLLKELLEFVGDRNIAVGRELTKKFETIYRGKVSEVINEVKELGEFVVVISPSEDLKKVKKENNND
jgi:16S rRNA (cytidine1402-2'-O)-methyltransferase